MKRVKQKMIDVATRLKEYENFVNASLEEYMQHYSSNDAQSVVYQAMDYSLMAGGKRLRPVLVLEFCKMFGGTPEDALPLACAVEMIHSYSLIHDDLPCMDDDDFRRGKPSCHKQFGEANALLAGDGLLTAAFSSIAEMGALAAEQKVNCISVLAQCAGVKGMVGGQIIDLKTETGEIEKDLLVEMYSLKTGALLTASCLLGAYAGNASDEYFDLIKDYAKYLGLAFQVVDDILDVTGNQEILGKPIGSDNENHKTTFVTLYGVDGASKKAQEYTASAKQALSQLPNNEFLMALTDFLCVRDD